MTRISPWFFYFGALLTLSAGVGLAIRAYPGGFDWTSTLLSALASRRHNPEGAPWFAGAIALSLLLLWPLIPALRQVADPSNTSRTARHAARALRVGIACGIIIGIERLLFHHLSGMIHKAHEFIALLAFAGFYLGILGLLFVRSRQQTHGRFWSALVALPIAGAGLSQLAVYLSPHSLGWAGVQWREAGLPFWVSLAVWQWLAVVLLWAALIYLLAQRPRQSSIGTGT